MTNSAPTEPALRTAGGRAPAVRIGFVATALVAVGYAPVAINYMWRYFGAGGRQLQATLTSAIDGASYATGPGSIDWLRAPDYQENRWIMLIHTSLGGLSLLLAVIQFLPATRRRPRLHRWCGRTFIGCMTISMVTAGMFLALAGEAHFAYAPALWLQLWVLGFACLSTGWLAVAMARRKNVAAHQGLMFLCFAFLMTAPGLRALWTGFHFLFPNLVLVDNLTGASIAETVLAPTLGVAAFILTRPNPPAVPARPSRDDHDGELLTGTAAIAITIAHYRATIVGHIPPELFWCYVLPMAMALGTCLAAEARSDRRGWHETAHRWRILFFGLLASIAATNATWLAGSWLTGQTGAYVASTMVTTGIPITIAGLILIGEITPSEGHPGTRGWRESSNASRSWIEQPEAVSSR